MNDAARTYSPEFQCRENETYESVQENNGEPFGCGNPAQAYIFFLLFQIICMQVFLNLFVAIIIDAFLGQAEMFDLPIQQFQIRQFELAWSKYDPSATGFIDLKDLEALLLDLAKSNDGKDLIVLRDKFMSDEAIRRLYIGMLRIPLFHQLKKVMFYDVLQ